MIPDFWYRFSRFSGIFICDSEILKKSAAEGEQKRETDADYGGDQSGQGAVHRLGLHLTLSRKLGKLYRKNT